MKDRHTDLYNASFSSSYRLNRLERVARAFPAPLEGKSGNKLSMWLCALAVAFAIAGVKVVIS